LPARHGGHLVREIPPKPANIFVAYGQGLGDMQFGLGRRLPVRLLARAGMGMAVTAGAASALAMALTSEAMAQDTLPGITVKGQKAAPRARPRPVQQQQAAPEAPPEEQQPVEQTAEQKERAAQEATYNVPAGVSVVGRSEIETFGSTNMDDVLRSIPGTWTRESPNNPGIGVNIRGLEGSGRVNMMIDGVRQNFRFTGHEAQGFAYVDPNLLAGVDIARGAVSTTGGAGALAGSANFRTLDVGDIIKYGQNAGILTTATWGSNNVGWSEMFAAGMRNGSVGVAGAISKRGSDNYKNGDGITVPFTDQDLISGLFKLEFTPSSEHFLKFGAVLYDNDFSANSYFQNIRNETFTMNYAYRPTHNPLVHLRFNAYKNDVKMEYLRGLNSFATAVGRTIEDEGWGFDISNTSRFNLGAVKVKAEYGYEYFSDDFTVVNPGPNPNFGVNPSGTSSTRGVFSQTTFSYGIFDLIAGLRYDTFQLDGSGAARAGNPLGIPPGPFEVDKDEGRLNPKVTLAAQALPWLQPYITYAETMRSPTINELLMGGTHPGGAQTQSTYPNPFLDPEISKGWEAGFNVKRDGILTPYDIFRAKVAYFNMDVENYIIGCRPSPSISYFCNVAGTSAVQGVELQAMYDARYAFAGLSYTYIDSDLPSQSNGLGAQSYLPDNILVLTAGLRFFDQQLTVGARGTFASEAFIGLVNNPIDPYTDGYTIVDLFSSYKFDSGFELGGTVTNVFDAAYTPATSTPPSSSCVPFPPTVCPATPDTGRGRTFLLTAKAQF
jgi:hemoglobin/transferrin/lactoferrin receptor protein